MTFVSVIALAAGLALSTGAQAADAGPAPERRPVSYACANGAVIDAQFLSVEGEEAVLLTFPDGRQEQGVARRLLPASQSGSGVRYASDITVLHVKGHDASFETAASALSEGMERTSCRAMRAPGGEPLTQAASAGRYLLARSLVTRPGRDEPPFREVETVCFTRDARRAIALTPLGEDRLARIDTWDGAAGSVLRVAVGPVDPGAGQRYYALRDPETGAARGARHFIAPGMAEPGSLGAAAYMSSVEIAEQRSECLALQDALYAAQMRSDQLVVRLAGDRPVLDWREPGSAVHRMTTTFVEDGPDARTLTFVSPDRIARIAMPRPGRTGGNRVMLGGAQPDTDFALAVFVADRTFALEGIAALPAEVGALLDRLQPCNHFAGEWSGVAERDAQLREAWERAGCESLDADYDRLLGSPDTDPAIRAYLAKNPPVWR